MMANFLWLNAFFIGIPARKSSAACAFMPPLEAQPVDLFHCATCWAM